MFLRFISVETQEKGLFVWVETQAPAMSVCFRT